jgi:hypothetical protein
LLLTEIVVARDGKDDDGDHDDEDEAKAEAGDQRLPVDPGILPAEGEAASSGQAVLAIGI